MEPDSGPVPVAHAISTEQQEIPGVGPVEMVRCSCGAVFGSAVPTGWYAAIGHIAAVSSGGKPVPLGEILVTTIVAARSGEGRLNVRFDEYEVQLSVAEARHWAGNLTQAAAQADTDALLFRFAKERLKATDEDAQMILLTFRKMREDA